MKKIFKETFKITLWVCAPLVLVLCIGSCGCDYKYRITDSHGNNYYTNSYVCDSGENKRNCIKFTTNSSVVELCGSYQIIEKTNNH
jgi:hypothetical protein